MAEIPQIDELRYRFKSYLKECHDHEPTVTTELHGAHIRVTHDVTSSAERKCLGTHV